MLSSPVRVAVVFMGVAGSGKSAVARAAAQALSLPCIEGDDFHSPENIEKMRQGNALTDADRAGWLDDLASQLASYQGGGALSCSALKREYRLRLRSAIPSLRFVFLDIEPALALARVESRSGGHPFPPSLVPSQFATLEDPTGEPGVLRLDASMPIADLTALAIDWLTRDVHAEH